MGRLAWGAHGTDLNSRRAMAVGTIVRLVRHRPLRGVAVHRWYAWATGVVSLSCGLLSVPIARTFWLERWTPLAACLVFLTNRWRALGIDVLEVARARPQWTLHNVGFLALQLVAIGVA